VEGNELCIEVEDSADCFEVWVAGQKIQLRRPGTDSLPIGGTSAEARNVALKG
jgi:hypothetical protein